MYEMKNLASPQLEYLKHTLRHPMAERHFKMTKIYVNKNILHIVFRKFGKHHPSRSKNYFNILIWQVEKSNPKLGTTPHYEGFFNVNGDPKHRVNASTIIKAILELIHSEIQRDKIIGASIMASVDYASNDAYDCRTNIQYLKRHINDFIDTHDTAIKAIHEEMLQ